MKEIGTFVLGLNHNTASLELREKVAFNPEEIPEFLTALIGSKQIEEAVLLSTCNRTELYVAAAKRQNMRGLLEKLLVQNHSLLRDDELDAFYFYEDDPVIRHLSEVTAGMDSMMLGEPQILGQVKDGIHIACETGTVHKHLDRLFSYAIEAGKRVRSETAIAVGAISVAYAAVELAQKIFKNLGNHHVLLIGAGETGELVAQYLKKKGVERIYITNRTAEKARRLAAQLDGVSYPFSSYHELLGEVDLVVGSTSATDFMLTARDVRSCLSKRTGRPLFLIDLAVPRDFDPKIARLENVFLHELDSLQQIVERNLQQRREEIPAAQAIIEEEVEKYKEWRRTQSLKPTIVALQEKFEEIRKEELKKYLHRSTPEEFEKLERATRGMLKKLLHQPISQLRRYGNGYPGGEERINVLWEMFNLKNSATKWEDSHEE